MTKTLFITALLLVILALVKAQPLPCPACDYESDFRCRLLENYCSPDPASGLSACSGLDGEYQVVPAPTLGISIAYSPHQLPYGYGDVPVITEGREIVYVCTASGLPSYPCTSGLELEEPILTYTGDTEFCAAHTCTTSSPVCSCTAREVLYDLLGGTGNCTTGVFLNPGNNLYGPLQKSSLSVFRAYTHVEPQSHQTTRSRTARRVAVQENNNFDLYLSNHTVVAVSPISSTYNVILNKAEVTESYVRTGPSQYPLDQAYYYTSGILIARMYLPSDNETLLVAEKYFSIVGESSCVWFDCLFCSAALNNWDCLSTFYKAILILTIIALSVLIVLMLIPIIVHLFYLCKWIARKSAQFYRWVYRGRRLRRPTGMEVLIIALMIPAVFAQSTADLPCSFSDLLVGTQEACTTTSGVTTCDLSGAATFDLLYVGSAACLQFTTQEGATQILKIVYHSAVEKYTYANSYYTSDYVLAVDDAYNCYGAADCTDSKCNSIAASGERTAGGILTNPDATANPGITTCEALGRKFDCFFNVAGCSYSAWGVSPEGSPVQVATLASTEFVSSLDLYLCDPNDTEGCVFQSTADVSDSTQSTFEILGGTVEIFYVGALTYSAPVLPYSHLVVQEGETYMADASAVNLPVSNELGNLQCPTSDVISDALNGRCIIDPGIVFSSSVDADYLRNFNYYEFNDAYLDAEVPGIQNGYSYTVVSENVIESILPHGPAIEMSIIFDGIGVNVVQTYACPDATFSHLEGFNDGPNPAVAYFDILSTCNPGAVYLERKTGNFNLTTSVLVISEIENQYPVYLRSEDEDVSGSIQFTGETGVFVVVDISGDLIDFSYNLTGVTYNHNGPAQVDNDPEETTGGWLQNVFDGTATWYGYVLFAIVAAIALALVIGLVVLGVYMVYGCVMAASAAAALKSVTSYIPIGKSKQNIY